MSIGCIAVDRHHCAQEVTLKYLDFFSNVKYLPVVFAEDIDLLNTLEEDLVLIYLKRNSECSISSTLSPFKKIYIIAEQNSYLNLDITGHVDRNIDVYLPEPGSTINIKLRSRIKKDSNLEINAHQSSHSFLSIKGNFYVEKDIKLNAKGKILMDNTAINSTSELYFKALHDSKNPQIKLTPILEVKNHQVIANHGSAIANLGIDKLWPFISRGLDKKSSKQLYIKSFLKGV